MNPERLIAYAVDPATMFTEMVGEPPDDWQRDILYGMDPRVLVCCSRQSGKSETVACLAAHTALFAPNSLTVMVSPSQRQSTELFGRSLGTIKKVLKAGRGAGGSGLEKDTTTEVVVEGGGRILSLPGTEGSIRGFSKPDLVLVDEAARVTPEIFAAVTPMLATSATGRLVLLSTPFGKQGFFYEGWMAPSGWKKYRVTADECLRITPAFLAREKASQIGWVHRQEYYCSFESAEASAFSGDMIERCMVTGVETLNLPKFPVMVS